MLKPSVMRDTANDSLLNEFFRDGIELADLPALFPLMRARETLNAFITLFRGGDDEVMVRLMILREIGARAEAPRWSPQELRAHFAYLDPTKLNTVLLRLRENDLLIWDNDESLYQISSAGRIALAAISTLIGFATLAQALARNGYLVAAVEHVGDTWQDQSLRATPARYFAERPRQVSRVIDTLLAVHNAGLVPMVPSQGSVGASGDLAPLSHMTLALLGEGHMLVDGQARPALPLLQAAGIMPLKLAAKEGLALINGTQTSTALALHALLTFEPVLEAALVIGALTVDAARGSDGPFDPRIHALRGQSGQIDVAQYYRALLAGSEIRRSHQEGDDRVQDPYCLRCQPQVVGACLDSLRHAALVLVREANAVTDNPLVFADNAAMAAAPGRPKQGTAPSGGSAAHEMASVGA